MQMTVNRSINGDERSYSSPAPDWPAAAGCAPGRCAASYARSGRRRQAIKASGPCWWPLRESGKRPPKINTIKREVKEAHRHTIDVTVSESRL
jgi:hypothetical protein